MHLQGYFKIEAYVPSVKIGDVDSNARAIIEAVKESAERKTDCMVFPELSVTGYTCADLFDQQLLMDKTEEAISFIAKSTSHLEIVFAVGAPVRYFNKRYNCAIMIYKGEILGIVPKTYLPNYGEFYEKRWFESGKKIKSSVVKFANKNVPFGTNLIFNIRDIKIGIEICEDLWVPVPPSSYLSMAGADIILNLSASDDLIGKHEYLLSLISQQSARCRCVYVYSSAGWGESSTDLVFSGKAIIAEDGAVYENEEKFALHPIFINKYVDIEKLKSDRAKFNTFSDENLNIRDFQEINIPSYCGKPELNTEEIYVNPKPFVPSNKSELNVRCKEIINIQSYGLMKRLDAINSRKAVIGISGGLDSTLALLITVKAFDRLGLPRKNIIGVTMPGLATSNRTKSNAMKLMSKLGITTLEIPIGDAIEVHFRDINQDPEKFDAAFENSQARERTQILMDLANKENGIVIGTGDMSELALGWCTYNGDQMSMYGVNSSVPKTLVKHLVNWMAENVDSAIGTILKDIIDTPISPELIPDKKEEIGQKTEDLVGPYELHDFFLYHFLRNSFDPIKIYNLAQIAFKDSYSKETILKWLKIFIKRFFTQQFKRSCMPDGPKVGNVNLSPRGDWRMPSDATSTLWLKQLEDIKQ